MIDLKELLRFSSRIASNGVEERERYHISRQHHRRIEGILMHPLRRKVFNEIYEKELCAARDVLRTMLGLPENLARGLGQQSIDEKICVRLRADGSYAFDIQVDFDDRNLM